MRKVCLHVLEKMEDENVGQTTDGTASTSSIPPEERVKLYCLENPLPPDMDLRTVKNLVWKSQGSGDLVITYSLIKSA